MIKIIDPTDEVYRNHITFTSVPLIDEITKPLNLIGLYHFSYDRVYSDDSHLRLCNMGAWLETFYRKKLYEGSIFEINPKLFQNGYILWVWLKKEPVYTVAAQYDIDHGIGIIQRYKFYTDFFHFGSKCNNYISPQDMCSKLSYLNKFILYFKDKAKDIIKTAEAQRFILPFNLLKSKQNNTIHVENSCDEEKFLNQINTSRFYLEGMTSTSHLTKREVSILKYLLEGYTAKQIACSIKISFRTVENYINILKIKLQCDSRRDFMARSIEMGITELKINL